MRLGIVGLLAVAGACANPVANPPDLGGDPDGDGDPPGDPTTDPDADSGANRPPMFIGEALPSTALAGQTFFVTVQGFDQDGDAITYTWEVVEGSAEISGLPPPYTSDSGTVPVVPTSIGTLTLRITVTDTHGAATSIERSVDVTSQAPVIDAFVAEPSAFVAEGGVLTLRLSAHEPEGQALSFTVAQTAGDGVLGTPTAPIATTDGWEISVAWTAPASPQLATLHAEVTDPYGTPATATLALRAMRDWKVVAAAFTDGDFAPSIALDASGRALVAYRDSGDRLDVSAHDGAVSTYQDVYDYVIGNLATDLVVDGTGTPYVAFHDDTYSPGGPGVMRYTASTTETDGADGDGWEYVGTTPLLPWYFDSPALAVDSHGQIYCLALDTRVSQAWGDFGVVVETYQSGSWAAVSLASDHELAHETQWADLAVAGDVPTVALADGGAGDRLTVMQYTGATTESDGTANDGWVYLGARGFSSEAVYRPRLVIDAQSRPVVAVVEGAAFSERAVVYRYDSGAWAVVGTGPVSTARVDSVDVGTLADGRAVVAYSSGSVTVLEESGSVDEGDEVAGDGWTYLGVPNREGHGPVRLGVAPSDAPYLVYGNAGSLTLLAWE